MNKIYEVGIKYDQIQQNGDKKRVTIFLLVCAISFSEAETKAATEMATYYAQDEFDIVSIRITKIKEYYKLKNAASTKFYRVKYNTITLDEKTAKEKKLSAYVVFEAESIDKAREYFKDYTKGWLCDAELAEVVETKIVDIIQ